MNEETVRRLAINKVNSIINSLPGQRQELEMRKRVLMNTHIRAVNNQKMEAVEKMRRRNDFFAATQGVQAKSARPEPSSDSDSDSDSDSKDSDSTDSDLSDSDSDLSDLSDPDVTEDKEKDLELENDEETDTTDFESEIEAALKGCSIGAKMGKKTSLVKKSVGLKRRNPQPASNEHQTMLERMQREAGELPPKQKRIRSHA